MSLVAIFVATTLGAMSTLASACFFDWDVAARGGPAGDEGDAGLASDAGDPTDGGEGGGPGRRCTVNEGCNVPTELCLIDGSTCGGSGVCVQVGNGVCGSGPTAVSGPGFCACDGRFFLAACDVADAGLGLGTQCPRDAGYLACGYTSCPIGTSFCRGHVGTSQFDCLTWGVARCTSMRDCACAVSTCNGTSCEGEPDGAVTVTCP
jgi:hypothetical protein